MPERSPVISPMISPVTTRTGSSSAGEISAKAETTKVPQPGSPPGKAEENELYRDPERNADPRLVEQRDEEERVVRELQHGGS